MNIKIPMIIIIIIRRVSNHLLSQLVDSLVNFGTILGHLGSILICIAPACPHAPGSTKPRVFTVTRASEPTKHRVFTLLRTCGTHAANLFLDEKCTHAESL